MPADSGRCVSTPAGAAASVQIWRPSECLLYWFVPYENLFGAKVFIPKIWGKMRLVGGVLFGSIPRSLFLQARRKPGALLFLTAALRRGIFLCVTPRRTLRNSAVKRTQTKLQPSKVFRIRPWCQARPADSGCCVSTPAGRFGDPRSTSCTGSCHMKICLGQRSSYGKYEARCGWSGGYAWRVFLHLKYKLLLHFSIYEIKKKLKKVFAIKICDFYKVKANFI